MKRRQLVLGSIATLTALASCSLPAVANDNPPRRGNWTLPRDINGIGVGGVEDGYFQKGTVIRIVTRTNGKSSGGRDIYTILFEHGGLQYTAWFYIH